MKFRYDPPPTTFFATPNNKDEMNHLICDFESSGSNNIPSESRFRNLGDLTISISNMVGIATNGVLLFNGNSPRNTDYFYPKDWYGVNDVDVD